MQDLEVPLPEEAMQIIRAAEEEANEAGRVAQEATRRLDLALRMALASTGHGAGHRGAVEVRDGCLVLRVPCSG